MSSDPLLDTVEQFAAKAEQRLFGVELPDGDLEAIDDLLLDAAAIGLLADVDVEAGRWGVWGAQADDDGVGLSLAVLRGLARGCAGLATAVHAQGLGVRLLGADVAVPSGSRVGAGFCPPVGIALDPRTADDGLRLVEGRLSGVARFVLSAGIADVVALVGMAEGQRVVAAVPVGAPGLRVESTGARIGLRAARMVDVVASDAVVDEHLSGEDADERLRAIMACDWLGQAAIALGCAERAVADANAYVATRYQGGVAIREHAAIRLLLGRAEHDLAVLASVLDRYAATPLVDWDTTTLLRWAIDARLAAGEHATRAATDALQTLGGYGYMDDYGLSKRLRDVTALRVLHGGPDQLLLARRTLSEVAP